MNPGWTRAEYEKWLEKMRLLGELEQERKAAERADPNGLKQFLIFLDEVHQIWRKQKPELFTDFTATNMRIERQKLLIKFPRRKI